MNFVNDLKKNRWIILAFLAITVLMVFTRLHFLNEPIDIDAAVYAYIGHEMLDGAKLYTELIDIKPPGIYLINMLGQLIWGYSAETIIYQGILFNIISIIFIFLILRLTTNDKFALLGSLFWALSSYFNWRTSIPNTEVYINSFLLIAIWALLKGELSNSKYYWLSGIAFAFATFIKMNVVFIAGIMCLYLLLQCFESDKKKWIKQSILKTMKIIIPIAVLWIVVFSYFAILGRFEDYYNIQFASLSSYTGNIFLNSMKFFTNYRSFTLPILQDVAFLFILAVLNIAWVFRKGNKNIRRYTAFFLFGSLLMISTILHRALSIHPYYYVVVLPAMVLGATNIIYELFVANRKKRNLVIKIIIVIIVFAIGWLSYAQVKSLSVSPLEISERKLQGQYISDYRLGLFFNKITTPDKAIYQLGGSPSIYLYSKRKAASALMIDHIASFAPGDLGMKYSNRLLNDLWENKPAFLILPSWAGKIQENKYLKLLRDNYKYYGMYGRAAIFERKGRKPIGEEYLEQFKNMPVWDGLPWEENRFHPKGYKNIELKQTRRGLVEATTGPKRYRALVKKANQKAMKRQWKEAEEIWLSTCAEFPEYPETHGNIGIFYEMNEFYYMACVQYEIVGKKLGEPWIQYYKETYEKMKQQAKGATQAKTKEVNAAKVGRIFVEASSNDKYAGLIKEGVAFVTNGKFREAEKLFEKARSLDKSRPEAWANLGVLFERKREFKKALKSYRIAADKLGNPWSRYYNEVKEHLE